jgi:hypothetical protein
MGWGLGNSTQIFYVHFVFDRQILKLSVQQIGWDGSGTCIEKSDMQWTYMSDFLTKNFEKKKCCTKPEVNTV